jgi:hypothetical protein
MLLIIVSSTLQLCLNFPTMANVLSDDVIAKQSQSVLNARHQRQRGETRNSNERSSSR